MKQQTLREWRDILRLINDHDEINHVMVVMGQRGQKSLQLYPQPHWKTASLDTLEAMAKNVDWAVAFRVVLKNQRATVFPVFFSSDEAIAQFRILETYLQLGGLEQRPQYTIDDAKSDLDEN